MSGAPWNSNRFLESLEPILVPVWPKFVPIQGFFLVPKRDFSFIEITKGEKSSYETRDPMMPGSFAIYSPYPLEYCCALVSFFKA